MATTDLKPGEMPHGAPYRAAADWATLNDKLGALANLPGRWSGPGFNLIARPDFAGNNDLFLQLSRTSETLQFTSIGSPVPNRGSKQGDIDLFGVTYLQQVSDSFTLEALHIEPGIWLNIPPTTEPDSEASISRLATIPHGDAVNLVGRALTVQSGPRIDPANTVPFPVGGTPPPPGTPNTFPEYDLSQPSEFRTNPLAPGITQALVDDPNTMLTDAIAGQNIVETEVLIVATDTGGGVSNIPFIVENANATFVSAIFWIEKVQQPSGQITLQLQYTQTVLLDFLGLSWPHVSVATLINTF